MSVPVPGVEAAPCPAAERGLAARHAALILLDGVLRDRQPLDTLIGETPAWSALESRDRAFARLLVATTLRRLGQIDAVLKGFLDRPLPKQAAAARSVLRLGAAQILFLGTPAHAAVASAVDLAAAISTARPFKGLVNAVLRRIGEQGVRLIEHHDAAWLNTPLWLWDSWAAAYGPATARAIAEAHLTEPPLDLTLHPDADPAIWAERLGATILPTGSLRRPAGGRIADLPGFAEGLWWVQDAAAALPARLIPHRPGQIVRDLCAAPGGKTAQLAAAGAQVVAVDRAADRVQRMQANLARLSLAAECIVADAATWRPDAPCDAILLDAPCSATGTIRRHPDVAHLKRADALPGLIAAQDRLLTAALAQLAPGGILVYCSCSLQPEEGPERIAALLARGAPARRLPVMADEVGGLDALVGPEGDVRTLPCHLPDQGGLDGFYACRLIRI